MAKNELQDTLDGISFKNSQIEKIRNMQEGKEKVKDNLGRYKQKVSSSARVKVLQRLKRLKSFRDSILK